MSQTPQRIQLRRTKGWRLPAGAVNVARPSRWGNPWRWYVTEPGWAWVCSADRRRYLVPGWASEPMVEDDAQSATVDLYRAWLTGDLADHGLLAPDLRDFLAPLRGHDLACWCPLDQPCHADVLLDLANGSACSWKVAT